jgi:hypothetical protein
MTKQNTFTLPVEPHEDDLACFIFMLSVKEAEMTEEELDIELRPPRKHWRDKEN